MRTPERLTNAEERANVPDLAWVLGVVVLALAAYLLLWPVPIEPVAWTAPIPEPLRRAAEHLDVCPECGEEFRACLAVLTQDGVG